jgi:Zn-finger nucleic acid-binding protein
MTERQSVEIDYCPKCRGVWLERGELDKIVELSAARGSFRDDDDDRRRRDFDDDDDDRRGFGDRDDRGRRRRGSFLGDMFDF